MYLISELAERVGLSRTALLHYEKLGLLKGRRQANGYRVYSEDDRQRLALLRRLQAGGLSLSECQACLDGRIDGDLLRRRLRRLDAEIAERQRARGLLAALLGEASLKTWHEEVERDAPDLHRAWLTTQGFSLAEAARVAWLSKDMNDHDGYMAAFMAVFAGLDRWGPGTDAATRRALARVPFAPRTILEIGCGPGAATMVLAAETAARITATDTDAGALARLRARAAAAGYGARIEAREMDMGDLPARGAPHDLIWAEGSAYIIGVARALEAWRPLLRPGGVLALSDMVWRTDAPGETLRAFWAGEYPAMATPARRLDEARRAGYRVLTHFDMGAAALDAYYRPLEARLDAMRDSLAGSRVDADLRAELDVWRAGAGRFGFEMFVVQRA